MVLNGEIDIGQVIYEFYKTKDGKLKEWIHISNPQDLIYSRKAKTQLKEKTRFLVSKDGGKTYQKYFIGMKL